MAKNDYLENRLLSQKCSRRGSSPEQMPAANERFCATAAGSADLKGSAEMPPLRKAAIPLHASLGDSSQVIQATFFFAKPDNATKFSGDNLVRN